ncbi:MAG: SUMF1/EgtB/PvdO family nonheme iron enzyme [Chloroherpetonaceae bacterium]|nr:SUMF1/EgtB/PvdO family nonheme iron enzyme [Chthonomonadaceae bacterium]MDW8206653.1 SUMF1/EgtB/PvdO family nonheme iron enzyme [Chloroherpetonaceae bacterium]
MVRIEAGPFRMGTNTGGEPDERPGRQVYLPAFWIDVHEVTNGQYRRFCEATGHRPPPHWNNGTFPPGQEDWPVVYVTWEDAAAYAKWAGKRLPTEAEWEKAARGTDGRDYPWGNTFDPRHAALEEARFGKVGRFPSGASPYGCLDMAGNVWEWTADWYDAYPGAPRYPVTRIGPITYSPLSIHYGKKYKVIRGGGAFEYYSISNTGRTADRARALPFAGYIGLGFRCVMDDGPASPFDTDISAAYVVPRHRMLPDARPQKAPLRGAVTLTVAEPAGVARQQEIVTGGVPFPQGALQNPQTVRLQDTQGRMVPLSIRVTGRWRDGSVRWLLLRFPCTVGATRAEQFRLSWDSTRTPSPESMRPAAAAPSWDRKPVRDRVPPMQLEVDGVPLHRTQSSPEQVCEPLFVSPHTGTRPAPDTLQDWQRDEIYADARGRSTFRARILRSGDRHQILSVTITQTSESPLLRLTRWSLPLLTDVPLRSCAFGGDRGLHRFALGPGDQVELIQESPVRYVLRKNGRVVATGTRAPGWVSVLPASTRPQEVRPAPRVVSVRDFWQQYPMALQVTPDGVILHAVTAQEPFDADRGIAKTITYCLATGTPGTTGELPAQATLHPLFPVAPPAWYCSTRALGDLAPYDLDRFADYETSVEADIDLWIRRRPHGFRHWGDAYMGGPYKGKNAYANLEYDVPYGLFLQFARTGHRKYLEAAAQAARHQADIDTNHITGQPWKHSPRHTETPAELGHVFLRGLITYTHFTGDPRGLETARQIGRFLNRAILDRGETGNERQIGWGLYALTAVYEATQDPEYLQAMKAFVDRLVAEQDATGKFRIRWDNRIAFFNGLAATGLIRYYELTGDETVATAILRLMERTLGFYPEYAGRTTEGLCWAYERTGDRRYLTAVVRMWETTLEFLAGRNWGPESTLFATRYLPFRVRHGLDTGTDRSMNLPPALLATDNGLHLTRVEAPNVTLWLQDTAGKAFNLTVFRHVGLSDATAELADGVRVLRFVLPASAQATTRHTITVPAGRGPRLLHLRLSGEQTGVWDIVTSRALPRVVQTPHFEGVHRIVPRIYFQVTGARLTARFIAEGEGFYGAVLYDPAGRVTSAVTRFIDLGDTRSYLYALSVPIPPGQRGGVWSMDVQGGRLADLRGATPWFAATRPAFFTVPERSTPPPQKRRQQ